MKWERRDFWSAIASLPFCMLTTSTGDSLRARPMAPRVDGHRHEIYFLTRLSSHKSQEITDHAQVNLAFVAPGGEVFISLSGRAALIQDPQMIDALWDAEADRWFPDGRAGGDVALVRVQPVSAERWDRAQPHNTYSWISFTAI